MVSKSKLGKVAAGAVAAGVLAVAGLGMAGTASADGGPTPGPGGAGQSQQRVMPNDNRPGPGGPNQGGPNANRVRPNLPGQGGPNGIQGGAQQRQQQGAPRNQGAAPSANAANNIEAVRAKGVIAASAEVLAMQPEAVLAGLEQGQTLTQVAAAHGQSRAFFLSELVGQIEKDIRDGQRFGIPASNDLTAQMSGLIDDAGLGLRGVALSNLY